jgi:hypothetical protein
MKSAQATIKGKVIGGREEPWPADRRLEVMKLEQ